MDSLVLHPPGRCMRMARTCSSASPCGTSTTVRSYTSRRLRLPLPHRRRALHLQSASALEEAQRSSSIRWCVRCSVAGRRVVPASGPSSAAGGWGCGTAGGLVEGRIGGGAKQLLPPSALSQAATTTQVDLPLVTFLASERAKVVAMLAFALGLCNADRVIMAVAIVPMAAARNWSGSFAGLVQSSFLWGYLLSPIPAGILADRIGGKQVLGWGVAIWSLATIATPWAAAHSLGMLLATRALMGLAEGVAMPCMNNMTARWFPPVERSRAVSVSMAGFHLGTVFGLILSPPLMANFGVAGPFLAFGLLGMLWVSAWVSGITASPESHPSIKLAELLHITRDSEFRSMEPKEGFQMPPLTLLLSKKPTWAIILANATNNWGYFILLSWMPVYFQTVFGVNLRQAAWFSAVPWAAMATAGFVAGSVSDSMIQAGVSKTAVRKIMQSIGFLGPAVALLCLNSVRSPTVASAWLTTALCLSAFSQAGFLVNHQEIGPKHAGVLHGLSNTAGTAAAIISTVGTGVFVEWLGSFQTFLTLTSLLYVISTMHWNKYATGDQVFQ